MGSGRNWTPEEETKAVSLHNQGLSYCEIADYLGRSYGGVAKRLNINGIKMPAGRPVEQSAWEGAAIGKCREYERLREDAIIGSLQLEQAIKRVGLRP